MEQPILRHGLIDTDIFIDASRGIAQAGAFLNEMLRGTGVALSVISVMEIYAGCHNNAHLTQVKELLLQFSVVPITEAISAQAQALMQSFTLSHGLLLPDAFIAATAIDSNIALYTRNIRHYKMIPELLIIQPY